jgi:hypothetical protein
MRRMQEETEPHLGVRKAKLPAQVVEKPVTADMRAGQNG